MGGGGRVGGGRIVGGEGEMEGEILRVGGWLMDGRGRRRRSWIGRWRIIGEVLRVEMRMVGKLSKKLLGLGGMCQMCRSMRMWT